MTRDDKFKTQMRNKNKFATSTHEWVYNNCEPDFYFSDIDAYSYAVRNNRLRIFEFKRRGESLSNGESTVLPKLSKMISSWINKKKLAPQSGVFVVRGDPRDDKEVEVRIWHRNQKVNISLDKLKRLIECKYLGLAEPAKKQKLVEIKMKQRVQYRDEPLEKGNIYDFPSSVAEKAVEEGYAKKL